MTPEVSGNRDRASHMKTPSIPRSARRARKTLRTGWTTGACAAAAAKAAAMALSTGRLPETVDIPLPKGGRAAFHVAEGTVRAAGASAGASGASAQAAEGGAAGTGAADKRESIASGEATAVVIKDAGDDPDVTHGAHVTVTLRPSAQPGLCFSAGPGVGVVTQPGLGLPVGEPAINPGPRRMIEAAIAEVFDLSRGGFDVVVSVPGGEAMAKKTSNPRLGIVGGISILGTTGIVRPFSTAAWRASVAQAIDVVAARGMHTLVLSTGTRTDAGAQELLPWLEPVCFVEVGDFTGFAVRRAARRGIREVVFFGMIGKLAKLASGVAMTHWTKSQVEVAFLAEVTEASGAPPEVVRAVAEARTARHVYEIWEASGDMKPLDYLCSAVEENLAAYAPGPSYAVVALDFAGRQPVGAGPNGSDLRTSVGELAEYIASAREASASAAVEIDRSRGMASYGERYGLDQG